MLLLLQEVLVCDPKSLFALSTANVRNSSLYRGEGERDLDFFETTFFASKLFFLETDRLSSQILGIEILPAHKLDTALSRAFVRLSTIDDRLAQLFSTIILIQKVMCNLLQIRQVTL